MATDYVFHHVARTLSTQDDVRLSLHQLGGRPVVVSADLQTAGRGRHGARWENASRSLSVSVGWQSPWPSERLPVLSLAAGLAAREAVGSKFPLPHLKWPNDLVTVAPEIRKLGGILVEATGASVVVGLGLNIWWPDAPRGYGALSDVDVEPVTVTSLARRFADLLFLRIDSGPDDWGRQEYVDACITIGRDITWQPAGSGRVVDVDDSGGLIVHTTDGVRVLRSGEVRHVRSTR